MSLGKQCVQSSDLGAEDSIDAHRFDGRGCSRGRLGLGIGRPHTRFCDGGFSGYRSRWRGWGELNHCS